MNYEKTKRKQKNIQEFFYTKLYVLCHILGTWENGKQNEKG